MATANDLPFDRSQLTREHLLNLRVPGALFSRAGAQDYVGSVPAITGTLFFVDAHLPAVREALCACFDDYEVLAKQHLTWLWREDPPDGNGKVAYSKAKPLRAMMNQLEPDDYLSFTYISGKQAHDAGEWEFSIQGMAAWEAKMVVRGTSALRFSMPRLYVEENPAAFQYMFVTFARRLKAVHGYGGHGLILSAVRINDNEPFEAVLAEQLNGFDVGQPIGGAATAHQGIKTVSWLTAVSNEMIEKVGGRALLLSELPMDWFAFYDYDVGIVIQGGPRPATAPADVDPKPACLALPNMLFKKIRAPALTLHHGSKNGEARIIGPSAEQWFKRFDVTDDEVMALKAKLLDESKLTEETTLPGTINRP